jgi:hypothetical protein
VIGNAHLVRLGRTPEERTPWDFSFEEEFRRADDDFPELIRWLNQLSDGALRAAELTNRFVPVAATAEQLLRLTECVVSLVVRSPRNREACVALAESLRGPLAGHERHALIGANLRRCQRVVADGIAGRGNFAVLLSAGREFIYGDGLFQNVDGAADPPHAPKLLVPVTPTIAVIVCRPMAYLVEPRLSTFVLPNEHVDACNHAVQVYSRESLFFRAEPPTLIAAFTSSRHLRYSHPDNPIDTLIRVIPGIPPRDTSLDFLRDRR